MGLIAIAGTVRTPITGISIFMRRLRWKVRLLDCDNWTNMLIYWIENDKSTTTLGRLLGDPPDVGGGERGRGDY